MKVLILSTDYSKPDEYISLEYIHTRNKKYLEYGIEVHVISFKTKEDYVIDGIKVFCQKTYETKLVKDNYDVLVSHAPNLKNHFLFIRKYDKQFNKIVFFFHGHEVLKTLEVYPKPYSYSRKFFGLLENNLIWMYDAFKLRIWKQYFEEKYDKCEFVFVSNWMRSMFLKYVGLNPKLLDRRSHIIYNSVGHNFEVENYNINVKKQFDFITIRNNIDGSKYCIDVVTKLAENNPDYKFCVIGRGRYYKVYEKPPNLIWIEKNLSHSEIIKYLNVSHCALIPTRADAQGVMACEMATFGIPLITSDIEICAEVFSGFDNVFFIKNDGSSDLKNIYSNIKVAANANKNTKYFSENTIKKEINLFCNGVK